MRGVNVIARINTVNGIRYGTKIPAVVNGRIKFGLGIDDME